MLFAINDDSVALYIVYWSGNAFPYQKYFVDRNLRIATWRKAKIWLKNKCYSIGWSSMLPDPKREGGVCKLS